MHQLTSRIGAISCTLPMSDQEPDFLGRLECAKLDAMKELAYGASHEINNPLANISARAQTLLRDEADPERRRALEAIHQQAMRAHEMISDLMLFARPPRLNVQPVEIRTVLDAAAAEVAGECRRREIELSVAVDADLPAVAADADQLTVAIGALCRNAVEAIGRGGRVELSATSSGMGAAGTSAVRIEIRDDGPGIAESVRPHIFDPFFSGREAGRGLGFGLSKAWRIVIDHGGTLTAESTSQRGAAFCLELPAHADGQLNPSSLLPSE